MAALTQQGLSRLSPLPLHSNGLSHPIPRHMSSPMSEESLPAVTAAAPDDLTAPAASHSHDNHKSPRHRDPAVQPKKSILRPSSPPRASKNFDQVTRELVPMFQQLTTKKRPQPPRRLSRSKLMTGTPITIRIQLEKEYSPEIVRCYPPVLISSLWGGPFTLGEPYDVTLKRLSGGTIGGGSRRSLNRRLGSPDEKRTTTKVAFGDVQICQ